ncbi:MAG: flagellar protein FlaG, partial [Alphaproteobacteria bacterium]
EILPPMQAVAPATAATNPQNSNLANATSTIGKITDHAVTSAADATDPNVRQDNANEEAPDQQRGRLIQNAAAKYNESSIDASVTYDAAEEEVYVKITRRLSGDTIAQFPSKELKNFLDAQFENNVGARSGLKVNV